MYWHKTRLYLHFWRYDSDYQSYLLAQLERTVRKRENNPEFHAKILIDRVVELGTFGSNDTVLCIGCRNTIELEYFRRKGFGNVIGIDLFSESPDVRIMDMHQMTFPNNHFSVVYSSHSLEHAHDLNKVIAEIVRVCHPDGLVVIEVPVRYTITKTDLIDFESVANLQNAFRPYISRVLWSDEQPPFNEFNDQGTWIARTIFSVNKPRQ